MEEEKKKKRNKKKKNKQNNHGNSNSNSNQAAEDDMPVDHHHNNNNNNNGQNHGTENDNQVIEVSSNGDTVDVEDFNTHNDKPNGGAPQSVSVFFNPIFIVFLCCLTRWV